MTEALYTCIIAPMQVVMFCFAALQALAVVFAALLARALPAWRDLALGLPVVGAVEVLSIAACAPAAGVVAAWVLGRHAWWAWPLQDAMGVSLMLLLLRQFRLPNIKVPPCLLFFGWTSVCQSVRNLA